MHRTSTVALMVLTLASCRAVPPQEQEPKDAGALAEPQVEITVTVPKPAVATRTEEASADAFNILDAPFALSSRLRIKAVDVGAGNCIAIQCPNASESLLVDCGTNDGVHEQPPDLAKIKRRADRALAEIPSFLGNRPVNLVITHPHGDHQILIPKVLEGKTVKGIWLGGYIKEYRNKTTLRSEYFIRTWLKQQETKGVPIHSDFPEGYDSGGKQEPGLTCGSAEVSILTVNAAGSTNDDLSNSHSLVTAVRYGNFQAIFPGDSEDVTENDILAEFSGDIKDTSVLFSAHHGAQSEGSNSKAWATALRAQAVVYSAGTLYGHPTCNAVNRFRAVGSLLSAPSHPFACSKEPLTQSTISEYVTERSGPIEISTDGNTFSVKCSQGAC
jgi:competence protein ComEC